MGSSIGVRMSKNPNGLFSLEYVGTIHIYMDMIVIDIKKLYIMFRSYKYFILIDFVRAKTNFIVNNFSNVFFIFFFLDFEFFQLNITSK